MGRFAYVGFKFVFVATNEDVEVCGQHYGSLGVKKV
jgi:hypothetical protein